MTTTAMLSERPAVIASATTVLRCDRIPVAVLRTVLPDLPAENPMPQFRQYILAGGSKALDQLVPLLRAALVTHGISDAIDAVVPPSLCLPVTVR